MNPRPIYESDEDLYKEKQVIKAIAEALGLDFFKLPRSYGLDYALTNPENQSVRAFVEIKARKNHSQRYPTLLLSLSKLISAQKLSSATSRPSYLVAAFTDGLFLTKLTSGQEPVTIAGRTDRDDPADLEPCIHFRVPKMRKVASFNIHKGDYDNES